MVRRYVYSGYMLCSWLVFSEYLWQVLQAGRSVLGLISAIGEWLIHVYVTSIRVCLLPHTVINMHIFLYLGFRRSLAYLYLSAANSPSSIIIGGNCVCVCSILLVCNLYWLLVASLTAGLNIVPIKENFSVMSHESSRENVSGYYRNLCSLRAGTRHHEWTS